ncbi:MAG TPA: sigma-70 family RNA polymerase sigma factor [Spirochaetota bacterium]|nr:sigma-70 family RNA polymerase sigma factor [Spirochaetota bacterium]HPL17963.1 sigma-70 family RNA polymerase sigma factor [Spirochaetota bacterium]HQJ73154.1 sigma-70 family RNA polymerase sigma factor [Spirochaetota bacterium]HRS79281.1 sigma-70 family RNA polymerase sigma factor [Spirochaetota bacterium]HRT77195.1 sigma-70 family RNA polymerase sigma factor [Spirochaetota bacterium]
MFKNDKKNQFDRAYIDYYQLVYGAIYSKTGNVIDADDLTQEVFIHYYEKMEEVEQTIPWLFGTIRLVLKNYFRKQMKSENDQEFDEFSHYIEVDSSNEWADTRMIIRDAIESIETNDRIIFELIAIQNLSYVSVGKSLGLNEKQIKYRYAIILKNIKAYLNTRGLKKIEDLL